MALKKVTEPIEAGYPDHEAHRRSRRRFLKDVATGVGAVVMGGTLSGCYEDKQTAGTPPAVTKPGTPAGGKGHDDGNGPPPKDTESWLGGNGSTGKAEGRLSGEVMPVRNPADKPLGGKPMMPETPRDKPLPGAPPLPRSELPPTPPAKDPFRSQDAPECEEPGKLLGRVPVPRRTGGIPRTPQRRPLGGKLLPPTADED